jgi:hypothetical protein
MVDKEESTVFLLRNIPRDLWGKVKHKAYEDGYSIREYILRLLEKDTKTWREKMGTEK